MPQRIDGHVKAQASVSEYSPQPAASPVRVLTFIKAFGPGGVERFALRLQAEWVACGLDPHLLVGDDSGIMRPAAMSPGAHLVGRPGIVALLLGLRRATLLLQPDILFCPGNTYSIHAALVRLMLPRRCPTIVVKVSNDLERRDMPPLLRLGYHLWLWVNGRLFDHFIGMADGMRDEISRRMHVPHDRITILDDPAMYAVDLARLSQARAATTRSRSGRRFLAIGRLEPQKNFALLLRAFAGMARPGDRLTILGEGSERAMLEGLASQLGLDGRVAMPGFVETLDHWMAEADALVVSSDYEGGPMVVMEAMAAGLYVIATHCSVGMPDLLGNGRFGTIVPVGDEGALAIAMETFESAPYSLPDAQLHADRFTVEKSAVAYGKTMARIAATRP